MITYYQKNRIRIAFSKSRAIMINLDFISILNYQWVEKSINIGSTILDL